MQGMGEQRLTIFLPSEISSPRRSPDEHFGSEVLDMILSIEKARAFGAAVAPVLLSSPGQAMTVSRGRELAILVQLGVSSDRAAGHPVLAS